MLCTRCHFEPPRVRDESRTAADWLRLNPLGAACCIRFLGLQQKFAQLTGQPLNRVLLRDISSLCYQHGCAGMGHSAADLSRALALLVSRLEPSSIITVGQGMGGYAALQFGTDLQRRFGNVRMLAFGPLCCIDAERARRDGDQRDMPIQARRDAGRHTAQSRPG